MIKQVSQILSPKPLYWENCKKVIKGTKLIANDFQTLFSNIIQNGLTNRSQFDTWSINGSREMTIVTKMTATPL